MNLLVAPDSFKGTLSAACAARAIADGIRKAFPEAQIADKPIADGGEGTVDVVLKSQPGSKHTVKVTGPSGQPVLADYAILENTTTAIIEMAAASGLTLVPATSRNIMQATTLGTGELIADALDRGAKRIMIGLGGSATCDGGLGCAQALGYRFITEDGTAIPIGAGPEQLSRIQGINTDNVHPGLSDCKITALCDVRNPLIGDTGAATVFAPQKGASPHEVKQLENALTHFASVINNELNIDIRAIPFGGAAGGLAAGLAAFAGAELVAGAETIFELIDLESAVASADAVITGEGKLDATTFDGKALQSLATLCQRKSKRLFALVGQLALPEEIWSQHFAGVAAIGSECSTSDDHAKNLRKLAQSQAGKWFTRR